MGLPEIARLPDRVEPHVSCFSLAFFLPLFLKFFTVLKDFHVISSLRSECHFMSALSFPPCIRVAFYHPDSRHRWCESGMSLIELIVVVAIIAIMATLAIPNLMPKRFEVKSATFNLRSHLMQARTAAVKTNSDATVNLDSANDTYNATCAGNTLFEVALSGGVRLSTGNTMITFKPLGTASSATVSLVGVSGNCTIKVKGSGRVFIDGDCPKN
jgi:prepilin-type N-terminal cleavage/methylation domain-containing protein